MNSAQLAELERMLNEGLARHAVPGAAVGLVIDDEEHFLTTGCTSVRAPVDVDTETLFQIGSTTKTRRKPSRSSAGRAGPPTTNATGST